MNIRKLVVRLILTLSFLSGTIYVGQAVLFNNYEISSVFATDFQTLEDLAEASPIVITAQIKEKGKVFTYSDVEFVKTKIKVQDILSKD